MTGARFSTAAWAIGAGRVVAAGGAGRCGRLPKTTRIGARSFEAGGDVMNRAEEAAARFGRGLSCSQAVLTAYAEAFDLDESTAAAISAGFGGGIGRMAATCGAVSGAVMILGLKHGGPDAAAKESTYEQVREFARRFRLRHGSLECRDLLQCDISTPEGREAARARGLHQNVCTGLVRDAAEILAELLGE
jgi:C_GCAxxG_C_C family probable redox protein